MRRRNLVIQIDKDKCIACGKCKEICSKVNLPKLCSGCGKCINICPVNAIKLVERTNSNHKTINHKTNKTMKKRGFVHVIIFLLAFAGFTAITMLLWNALLPSIFGISNIDFWQALGLLALSRILFGGIGSGIMRHLHKHHNPIHDKWKKMTPEQRKEFIDKRRHFGFGNPFDRDHSDMFEHEESGEGNDRKC